MAGERRFWVKASVMMGGRSHRAQKRRTLRLQGDTRRKLVEISACKSRLVPEKLAPEIDRRLLFLAPRNPTATCSVYLSEAARPYRFSKQARVQWRRSYVCAANDCHTSTCALTKTLDRSSSLQDHGHILNHECRCGLGLGCYSIVHSIIFGHSKFNMRILLLSTILDMTGCASDICHSIWNSAGHWNGSNCAKMINTNWSYTDQATSTTTSTQSAKLPSQKTPNLPQIPSAPPTPRNVHPLNAPCTKPNYLSSQPRPLEPAQALEDATNSPSAS
jgi:hypothetical protein